ncbi:hypothetical protein C8R44DRAFT_750978 [Mycena epipterygia]|nr:hypothetical protein C8R44DRAFT_750978 [Mycena epipterygia]
MAEVLNTPLCDDCHQTSPHREGEGSCNKCVKLAAHQRDSPEYADISTWDQCMMCGVTRRNNMYFTVQNNHIATCGALKCKAEVSGPVQEHRSATHNVPSTILDRAVLTRNRFKLSASNKGPTSSLQTQTLQHEHRNGDPGEEKIMIDWQVRTKKGLNADLGQGAKAWATSNRLLPDVKAELTSQISREWEHHRSSPLLPEHISIQWAGNRMPVPDTSNLTISEFYIAHATNENAAIYLDPVPTVWKSLATAGKRKHGFMALELYVDQESWAESISAFNDFDQSSGSMISSALKSVQNKPRRWSGEPDNTIVKCLRGSEPSSSIGFPLHSEFRISTLSGPAEVHTRSHVSLWRINCIVTPDTGVPEFEHSELIVSATLGALLNHWMLER